MKYARSEFSDNYNFIGKITDKEKTEIIHISNLRPYYDLHLGEISI